MHKMMVALTSLRMHAKRYVLTVCSQKIRAILASWNAATKIDGCGTNTPGPSLTTCLCFGVDCTRVMGSCCTTGVWEQHPPHGEGLPNARNSSSCKQVRPRCFLGWCSLLAHLPAGQRAVDVGPHKVSAAHLATWPNAWGASTRSSSSRIFISHPTVRMMRGLVQWRSAWA